MKKQGPIKIIIANTAFIIKDISAREADIIKLLLARKRPKEIASILNLSYHTIVKHKRNIYAKLKVNNTIELAQYVYKTCLMK